MRISVTQEDILRGKPMEACACPIYLAIARALPELAEQGFTVGPLGVIGNASTLRGDLPEIAEDFMNGFDAGREVEPFEFDLEMRPVEFEFEESL